jgi:hypothetical protein
MQLIQKRLISISGFAVFIFFGYLAFQNFSSSQLDEHIIPVSQSGTSVIVNTGKTLSGSTVTLSGTWTDSPFGSGKPLTGAEKPVFKIPNTEWKTRTLNINGKWLTYEYGKGNPNGVMLTATGIQQESHECEMTSGSTSRMCREGMYGYVTPEIEIALRKALESPLWEKLVTECHKEYSLAPFYDRFQRNVLAPQALNLSRFLIIDERTGRKEIETTEIREVVDAISSVGTDDSGEWKNVCIRSYGKPLYQMLNNITSAYNNTVSVSIQDNHMPSH